MTHNSKLQSIAERMVVAYRDGTADPVAGLEYAALIEQRMSQHAEHITLFELAAYQPRHAPTERFKRWAPTVVYSRAPLLTGDALPSFYDAAATHIAMGFLHTARARFGSDAVARRFYALAQAAKRRAVAMIQERIARART